MNFGRVRDIIKALTLAKGCSTLRLVNLNSNVFTFIGKTRPIERDKARNPKTICMYEST